MLAKDLKIGDKFTLDSLYCMRVELPTDVIRKTRKGYLSCIIFKEEGAIPSEIEQFIEVKKSNFKIENITKNIFTIRNKELAKFNVYKV